MSTGTRSRRTFCPVGANENTLPGVVYCSFAFELSIKEDADVEREWGDTSFNCIADMQAQNIDIWRVHPLDPACWVLGPDDDDVLIPSRGTENMYLVFNAEGIGMRVWNSSDLALSENPSNSTFSQGIRVVFGSGDLVQLTESNFKRLGEEKETSYTLNQFGSFPLATLGLENVTVLVLSWTSDQVFITSEKQTISILTLVAIIAGSLAVAIDLIFKNFLLLFYALFVYRGPGGEATGKMTPMSL